MVFDLWGTLVDDLRTPETNQITFGRKMDEMADLLGVGRSEFTEAWFAGMDKRMVGALPSTEAVLSQMVKKLGIELDEGHIHAVANLWYVYVRGALYPRPGTVETLSILRDSGYKIGLISNCTEEFALLWDSTPFAPLVDTAILSFEVGLAKPDPGIYQTAVERLKVAAEQCLYVGDGADGELSGASEAGMTAVLMRASYDSADGNREGWKGEKISDIRYVMNLL